MKDGLLEKCKELLRFHGSMTSQKLREKLGYELGAYKISIDLGKESEFQKEGKKKIGTRSYIIWSLKE